MKQFFRQSSDEYWISVADMMSGLMMIFLLIAIIYIHNFQKQADEIENTRERICNEIIDKFSSYREQWNMSICEGGLLVSFENDSVFDKGKAILKPEFKTILNDFFPTFMDIVISNKEDIGELRIEGHTSSEYSAPTEEMAYVKNTELSQKRSYNVMNYSFNLIQDDNYHDWMIHNLTAHGMSSARLELDEFGNEDKKKSRRVEFRIETNVQEKLIQELQKRKNQKK